MTFGPLARTRRSGGVFAFAGFAGLAGLLFSLPGAVGSARAAGAGGSAPVPPAAVEIDAADGLKLHGTYYAASSPGPIVLMLHQCNKDRTSWEPLGRALSASGIHALAFDFRGIGESQNAENDSFPQYHDALWTSYTDDVDRMMKFLRTLPDVEADRLGVVGSACGGSQALLLAVRESKVKALCFFSTALPWISNTDYTQFTLNRTMPMLMISSEGDREAPKKSRMLFDESRDPMSKLIQYKGEQHGTELFNQDPGLADSIVRWFGTVL
jgi:dienelactone hydrolase